MALSCKEIVELVTDYLEGELDEGTAAQVRAHLAICDGCERYVEQVRATADAVGEMPADTLPDDIRDGLLAAFREFRG